MKRGKMSLFLLMVLSLLVTACGNEAGSPAQAAGQAQAEQTRTITHAMGKTQITGTPERIVVLTNQGTESLLALGIKPVGAVKSWIGEPWFDHIKDQMSGVEVVGDEVQPNVELIASLKPDLILGTKVRQEKIYSQLSSIAPTVFTENLGDSMIENFELYGTALNKDEEAAKVVADFNKMIEDTKAKLGEKTKMTISMARFQPNKARVYYKQNFAGVILDKLGFARPDAQNQDKFSEDIAKEQMNVLDGDVFFYFASDREGDTGATKTAQEWLGDPLAQNLNVTKKGHTYQVNEAIWNTAGGIEAAKWMIQDIEQRFAAINP
ncbi:ABC transporter substrate-binding protein [Brevibacillus sp. NRS-1366]|uniref:ABC transporter substrate-binding protein n=1 Tax=Brevibacillus sp. NRS-1366 TaxID=3233899 RepID=UPI003D256FF5